MTKKEELKALIRQHQEWLSWLSDRRGLFGYEIRDKRLIIAKLKKQLQDMPAAEREKPLTAP